MHPKDFFYLTEEYFRDNPCLTEKGTEAMDKTTSRGYGVMSIVINGVMVGVPLRSDIKHEYSCILDYIYERDPRTGKMQKQARGIDFTKVVVIQDPARHLGEPCEVDRQQKKTLKKINVGSIRVQLERYVRRYVNASLTDCNRTLNRREYRWSTLKYFHQELGILKQD